MKSRLTILLVALVINAVSARRAYADGFPLINDTVVSYSSKTLTISGTNFGTSPKVTLGTVLLGVQSATTTQIVASFPAASPLSNFAPGDYFLLVVFANRTVAIFDVTLGAVGPQGMQGLIGPQGAKGDTGATGATGPAPVFQLVRHRKSTWWCRIDRPPV